MFLEILLIIGNIWVLAKIYFKERLKKRNDIIAFFENRADLIKSINYFYTILGLKNNRSYSRFAVSMKRNKSNAVIRNREKRIVREIYRTEKSKIPAGYDYFIIVKKKNSRSFEDCKRDLLELFKKFEWGLKDLKCLKK